MRLARSSATSRHHSQPPFQLYTDLLPGNLLFENRFYLDFSSTYDEVGMVFPYMINISLLIEAYLMGTSWPWIEHKNGICYTNYLSANMVRLIFCLCYNMQPFFLVNVELISW
ncbi:Oligopeptide transporter [Quillaja saponaria]|uniref:Oligopeptide transporter n=1 Tax=Quillaja saponaria TaxID=32244 RepID=A0AAD7LY26_QUISA|nr:Oligopeptide transporter [Quillaja saponaria]